MSIQFGIKQLIQIISIENDFDYLLFSKTMRTPIILILLCCLSLINSKKDAFTTLIAYQNNQRLSAQVGANQYHLLPFRVTGVPQHFIQAPQVDQFINVEVQVHWIGNNSALKFPDFDLSQKVRLVIEQENIKTAPTKSILTKQFLTQTGFKIQLRAGCSYRWKIESSGKIPKLVEIAIVKKTKNMSILNEELKQVHQSEVQILSQMKKTLEKAKFKRSQRDNKVKEKKVSDMWAWMSGIEMASLLAFLLVQVSLFEKFMLPRSVV